MNAANILTTTDWQHDGYAGRTARQNDGLVTIAANITRERIRGSRNDRLLRRGAAEKKTAYSKAHQSSSSVAEPSPLRTGLGNRGLVYETVAEHRQLCYLALKLGRLKKLLAKLLLLGLCEAPAYVSLYTRIERRFIGLFRHNRAAG